MTTERAPLTQLDILQREAGGNPWVLEAIIERELVAQELVYFVDAPLYVEDVEGLRDLFDEKTQLVELRKELAGIKQPEPLTPDATDN